MKNEKWQGMFVDLEKNSTIESESVIVEEPPEPMVGSLFFFNIQDEGAPNKHFLFRLRVLQ